MTLLSNLVGVVELVYTERLPRFFVSSTIFGITLFSMRRLTPTVSNVNGISYDLQRFETVLNNPKSPSTVDCFVK